MNDAVEDALEAAMEGEPEATQREWDAVRRALTRLESKGFILKPHSEAVVVRHADPAGHPVPRLQLRWEESDVCHYELILPLKVHDIRGKVDADGEPAKAIAVPIGRTTVFGGRASRATRKDDGSVEVDIPYRDGAHARWDSKALGIPAYAICGSYVMQIMPARTETA